MRPTVALFVILFSACAAGGRPAPAGVLATAGLNVVPSAPAGTAPVAAWPSAGHDARHSGSTALLGPTSGLIRWERRLEGPVTPGPAVGADGTVYAASNGGVLHALDPRTGADRWTFDGGGSYGSDLSTTPAVLADGTVVWPGPGGVVHGIDATGRPLWQWPLAGFALSPAELDDGSVVVADMTGTVAVLEWAGSDHSQAPRARWSVDLGGVSYASPAVGRDGTIYGAADRDLVALDPATGAARWHFSTGDIIEVSPAVAPDGTVVIASNDPFTYGVAPDGMQRWRHRRGSLSFSSPSVTATGLVFAGDHRGGVAILDLDTGRARGRLQGQGPTAATRSVGVWTAPAVDGAHRSYFGTRNGHVYGFGPDGTRLFDLDVGATVDSYPALTADGALVIGVTDGRLLAIADDTLPCVTARRAVDGAALAYSPSRPDAVVAVQVSPGAAVVGLGVDDGPDARFTPQVLAVLARHRARATFFLVGEQVDALPEVAASVVPGGHEVANHTWSHQNLLGRSPEEVATELERTRAAIGRAGGDARPLLRPPQGEQDEVAAEAACRAGLRTIGWTATLERHVDNPEALAGRIGPGEIVLVHDGRGDRTRSVDALDRFLTALDDRGIRVVGVDELLSFRTP